MQYWNNVKYMRRTDVEDLGSFRMMATFVVPRMDVRRVPHIVIKSTNDYYLTTDCLTFGFTIYGTLTKTYLDKSRLRKPC